MRSSAGKRVAAKSCPVRARLEKICVRFRYPDRANWEAATEPFCHSDSIGLHAALIKGEEMTGTPNATLHLIQYEEHLALGTERAQLV